MVATDQAAPLVETEAAPLAETEAPAEAMDPAALLVEETEAPTRYPAPNISLYLL